MKKAFLAVLVTLIVFVAETEVYAQIPLPRQIACKPSAEEILSLIKTAYNISPETESVLVTGESQGVQKLRLSNERQLTISLALAITGRSIRTISKPIYVIRPSNDEQSQTVLEIKAGDVLTGLIKDVKLEMGDVVFVSMGCTDGKLLQPTKRKYLPEEPRHKDYIPLTLDKRNVR
jgi:hypothetical protein